MFHKKEWRPKQREKEDRNTDGSYRCPAHVIRVATGPVDDSKENVFTIRLSYLIHSF